MAKGDEAWKQDLRDKRMVVHNALSGHNGQELVKLLENTFQRGVLFNENPLKMARNTAHFEVVQYLKELLKESNDV